METPTPQSGTPHYTHDSLTSYSKVSSYRSADPSESQVGSWDVLSASVLSTSSQQPRSTVQRKPQRKVCPHLKCTVRYRNWLLGSVQLSLLSCLQEGLFHIFYPFLKHTPPHQHKMWGHREPLLSCSTEHNCSDESQHLPSAQESIPLSIRGRLALPREVTHPGEAQLAGVALVRHVS